MSTDIVHERRSRQLETEPASVRPAAFTRPPTAGIRDALLDRILRACEGCGAEVEPEMLLSETLAALYPGADEKEIDRALVLTARAHIENDPAYSFVAARLLLDSIYGEAIGRRVEYAEMEREYPAAFRAYIRRAVHLELLSPELLSFDLEQISTALHPSRDRQFKYMGIQTLYDRYLIHEPEGRRIELPQSFWMRVAMGLALNEDDRERRAIEFYDALSTFHFCSSTPTLFNAGTLHPQLSSCYLTTIEDDLEHIFKSIQDDAMLSKWSGGLGNDWTNVRALGSHIKGTNGKSQGIIPFLRVANDTAVAVNQGGRRRGAISAYLETWHLDIEEFLDLRKNTGDERRRTPDMHTANWIPDLFMKRVRENGEWTLFSPSDTPDLHHLYGRAFERRYAEYEEMTRTGEIHHFKRVQAVSLWRKMISMLFETGHPWLTFKDPSNVRSPQDHVGVIHNSNLCTEITLNTSRDEVAVCNLGSVNVAAHVEGGRLDMDRLKHTVTTAMRMLDNVIDMNFYPIPEARRANERHRPVGLGLMGFQDALYKLGVSYASPEAVEFADRSMEAISYFAILASTELASERGAYPSFNGSKWDRGLLPIDTIRLLAEERGGHMTMDTTTTLDWDVVRRAVRKHGMRNSNTMAIAPTATISNIQGVSQSIEPTYRHLFVKSNLSGDFTVVNEYLVEEFKRRGLWDAQMVDDLKYYDGSLQEIERIPDAIKALYPTAFEVEPEWLIECASRRQKWIDMAQSLNLYAAGANGKRLSDMYFTAWEKGLKTTYYLRALAATQVEKSTVDVNRRGIQPRWMKSKSASSNIQVGRPTAAAVGPARRPLPDPDEFTCDSCQ